MDRISSANTNGALMLTNTALDGTMEHRALRPSARDIPHNFVATTAMPVRGGFIAAATVLARSGTPYAFITSGDANADGVNGNDLVYVPRSASDITLSNPEFFPALDSLIKTVPCLAAQRGRVMKRNSCRNKSVTDINLRVTKRLWSQGPEISADVFNVANLVNRRWGLIEETSPANREGQPLLTVFGWDAAQQRPRYSLPANHGMPALPPFDKVSVDASRWRMQLGARLDF